MQEYYLLPMLRFAACLLLACLACAAHAQDYAREARWRAEVVPNLVVGDAVDLHTPAGHAFLALHIPGEAKKPAVVLVHGRGVHPDHGVIGALRMALADMGFATLSIQMPVLAADARAEDYQPALFPEAAVRIAAAAEWLARRGHNKLVLASHSLGSWMSQHYLESAKPSAFAAWICMGRGGGLGKLGLPVLDVYGEKDDPVVLESAMARRAALERIAGSKQRIIAGADHFYTGKEDELARALREFIEALRG
jgi:pimeloyl-ACP methyl ester carboxylesterase